MTKKNTLLIIFLLFIEACAGYGISKYFLRKNLVVQNWLNASSFDKVLGEDYAREKLKELDEAAASADSQDELGTLSDAQAGQAEGQNAQVDSQGWQIIQPQTQTEAPAQPKKVRIVKATESSHIVQEGKDNTAYAAIDGKEETSWQEGVDGDGVGSWLQFDLDKEYDITGFIFKLGNWNDAKDYYNGNNRPKELLISFSDGNGDQERFFEDKKEQVPWNLDTPVRTDVVRIQIESVYEGDTWDDTCIAEIEIYGIEP